MKKTLAALAVLGAFAGSAMAADVTLYGLVDYGFSYEHADGDISGVDAQDTFQMKTGQNSGSRFGLKGTEDLGNGLKVGFVLENGFTADDGKMDNSDRLFGRESNLFITGAFGTLSFGRVGQLASANGTFGLLGVTSPFSSGWGDSIGPKFVTANGWAQYSFGTDSAKTDATHIEGQSSVDRYYGLGAKYVNNSLTLVGVVDSINYQSYASGAVTNMDDSLTVTLGGNYDFGVVKPYLLGQYFKNAKAFGQKNVNDKSAFDKGYTFSGAGVNGAKGWGLAAGVDVPAFGGTAKALLAYGDAEGEDNSDMEVSRWVFSVGYAYNLSKRTSVYTAASYMRDDVNKELAGTTSDINPSSVEVAAGLIHKF